MDIKEKKKKYIGLVFHFKISKLFPSCKLKSQKEKKTIGTFHFANILNDIVVVESFVLLFEFLYLHLLKLLLTFYIGRSEATVSCEEKKHF